MRAKDVNYFDIFIKAAEVCCRASKGLEDMLGNLGNKQNAVSAIHNIEHEGDELYHKMYGYLRRSFITPIEREDILNIARYIEEAIDTIDDVAIMFNMLSVDTARPEAHEFVKLITKSCNCLVQATEEFKHYKKSKQLVTLLVEINHIEEEGDKLYQEAIKTLFSKETNVLEVIKWKNIFDAMESVLDAVENVTDVMEGVIVNNS